MNPVLPAAISADIQRDHVDQYRDLLGHDPSAGIPALFLLCLLGPLWLQLQDNVLASTDAIVHVRQDCLVHRPIELGPVALFPAVTRDAASGLTRVAVRASCLTSGSAYADLTSWLVWGAPTGPIPEPAVSTDATCDVLWAEKLLVPADLACRYAAMSGDRNPIHLDLEAARQFGFSQPIVHGAATLALASARLERHLHQQRRRVAGLTVRFASPTFGGDELTMTCASSTRGEVVKFRATRGGSSVLKRGVLRSVLVTA